MHTQSILLASLLVALYGCQPEAPVQQVAAPAAVQPPVTPASTEQAATSEVAAPAPVQQAGPATVEKTGQSAVAEKPVRIAPALAVTAPVAKVEPAAAGVKPEIKSEPAVSEADALQLAKKSNCLACHAIDKKVVGPAWRDVAAKYRGDAEAEAKLVNKIAKGGSGVWGAMVMPPNPQVSEADRKTLAKFVLSLK